MAAMMPAGSPRGSISSTPATRPPTPHAPCARLSKCGMNRPTATMDCPQWPRQARQRQQHRRIAQSARRRQPEQPRRARPPDPMDQPDCIQCRRLLVATVARAGDHFRHRFGMPRIEHRPDAQEQRVGIVVEQARQQPRPQQRVQFVAEISRLAPPPIERNARTPGRHSWPKRGADEACRVGQAPAAREQTGAVARQQPRRRQSAATARRRGSSRQTAPDRRAAAASARWTRPASTAATAASAASAASPGSDAAPRSANHSAPNARPPAGARQAALPHPTAAPCRTGRCAGRSRQWRAAAAHARPCWRRRVPDPRATRACGYSPSPSCSMIDSDAAQGRGHQAGSGASQCGRMRPPIIAGCGRAGQSPAGCWSTQSGAGIASSSI